MNISINNIGIVSAIGNNAAETLNSLKDGRSGIAAMKYLPSTHSDLPVGEVKLSNDAIKEFLGIPNERIVSRTTLLGAMALKEATNGINLNGKRVALISGTTVGGMDVTEHVFKRAKDDDAMLQYIKQHDCGSQTKEMAEIAGLQDAEVCTISTACSAALNAIIIGCEMLKANEVDVAIVGGTEALSCFHLNGFNSLMILDHEPCKPFCRTRQGLNLGEGAAFIVLETQQEHDATHHSFSIAGYANRCDAYHQTASSSNGEGAFLAMSDALKMAGLKPSDIDYVNAHGTGTPDNDKSESEALRRVFGDSMPPVSSTKSLTGHTTSASGAIETVISILAMNEGIIPQNAGWQERDDDCIVPSTAPTKKELHAVMCNSFGFGGNDSSLIITQNRKDVCCPTQHAKCKIIADTELSSQTELNELSEYVSPRETRRMGNLLKAATLTSLKALKQAGIEKPDAIITATSYGMLENSERFLSDMIENGEQSLSPTLFMQSTHNTIGSAIAIRLKCHGYNITYTQGKDSLEWAMRDAERLIATGKAETVLVGVHDEATPLFQSFYKRMNITEPKELYSRVIILKRDVLQ